LHRLRDRGAASAGSLFDSTLSTVGQTFSFTFRDAGTYPYFCRFHENVQAR
jgi:plastocyanin